MRVNASPLSLLRSIISLLSSEPIRNVSLPLDVLRYLVPFFSYSSLKNWVLTCKSFSRCRAHLYSLHQSLEIGGSFTQRKLEFSLTRNYALLRDGNSVARVFDLRDLTLHPRLWDLGVTGHWEIRDSIYLQEHDQFIRYYERYDLSTLTSRAEYERDLISSSLPRGTEVLYPDGILKVQGSNDTYMVNCEYYQPCYYIATSDKQPQGRVCVISILTDAYKHLTVKRYPLDEEGRSFRIVDCIAFRYPFVAFHKHGSNEISLFCISERNQQVEFVKHFEGHGLSISRREKGVGFSFLTVSDKSVRIWTVDNPKQ